MRLVPSMSVLCCAVAAIAQAPQHWSYRPIERPAAMAPANGVWPGATSLDAFVLARMQPLGLEPSPAADRATWLRRVTLDLTGLPPTQQELDTFLADPSDGARERVVDRLLGTDAFAERWACWWLDLARYADSQGYEKDGLRRGMWRYRDWLIDAFRRDLPFDRFTIEQLAGDLLPDASDETRLATAFHRQTMTNTEGGTDDEEFRVAAVVDRVDTTMSVWMGSTLGCAQCHDHKYDPFAQREFFELFAFFDQTEDKDRDDDAPVMYAPTPEQVAASKAIELELTVLREQLAGVDEKVPAVGPWRLLGPIAGTSFEDARDRAFAPERDGVVLDQEQEGRRWQLRDDFVDGTVHAWRGDDSAFYLHRTIGADAAMDVVLSLGSDDSLAVWWNGREVLRKDVGRAAAPDQELVPIRLEAGDNSLLLKVTNGRGPGGFYFRLDGARSGALRGRIAALEKDLDAQRGAAVPILKELPPDQRRTTRVHRRGSFLDQGDEVTPDTPTVWPAFGDELPRNRLGLARWLMRADNPLTARVLANRIWSELFGQGLVATLEDFGSQGDTPTHPELLDWLACELRDSGWSLRHLLRTVVLSATYGQSAAVTARHLELDPQNHLLTRGPSFRLSAEALRDQALAVSGLLTRRVGGPSVMPPQPDGIWRQIYSGAKWQTAEDEDRYRRTLYTFWRRTSPHPALLVFDAASREACVLRRQRTNTPLQALVLWNDPQFQEPAAALADRALALETDDDDRRVAWLWRQCLLREPAPAEVARLRDLLDAERARGVEARAAWTLVGSVVLALDEMVTRG